MKIGLNATCLNDRPSGAKQRFVGIYTELVNRLPDVEFVVYEPVDCRVGTWFDGSPNVTIKRTPIPSEGRVRKFVNGLGYWQAALERERFDIFECFNLPLVKAPTGQTILTIHDIRGMHSKSALLERTAYRLFFERSLIAADHIVTVSQAMKDEILSFFPRISISVIYNGLDAVEFAKTSEEDILAFQHKYKLPENFILAVGHIESRKNYLYLIDAIAKLRDQGNNCNLLIVGNDNGELKAISERIASKKINGNVKFLSGLSDQEVRCAYKLCNLFVFPSSYEGFGIPILEAMAAERPMVLSNLDVFRELTQDKGIYFPHENVELMADAIQSVHSSISERNRLVEYGKQRVQAFAFKSLSEQVATLYQTLVLKNKVKW